MLTTRRGVAADAERCVQIVAGLPDYFTDDVHDEVRLGLAEGPAWVIVRGDGPVLGFVHADLRSSDAAEIRYMAVDAAERGHGIGTTLLDAALIDLAASGVRVVEVKTLDEGADYPPYDATRAFWERHGFVKIDSIDPLPGWDPGNPSAIYIAALAPTR